jgi:hypothetical protein
MKLIFKNHLAHPDQLYGTGAKPSCFPFRRCNSSSSLPYRYVRRSPGARLGATPKVLHPSQPATRSPCTNSRFALGGTTASVSWRFSACCCFPPSPPPPQRPGVFDPTARPPRSQRRAQPASASTNPATAFMRLHLRAFSPLLQAGRCATTACGQKSTRRSCRPTRGTQMCALVANTCALLQSRRAVLTPRVGCAALQVQCWRRPPCIRWSWLTREKCTAYVPPPFWLSWALVLTPGAQAEAGLGLPDGGPVPEHHGGHAGASALEGGQLPPLAPLTQVCFSPRRCARWWRRTW